MDADRQKLLDDLKTAIQEVEGAFRTLLPGSTASVPLNKNEPNGPQLGFQRFGSTWQVVYLVENKAEPLVNKSIKTRLDALPRLPDLYTRLCLNEEAQMEQVEQALKDLRAFTTGILAGSKVP